MIFFLDFLAIFYYPITTSLCGSHGGRQGRSQAGRKSLFEIFSVWIDVEQPKIPSAAGP